MIGPHGIDVDPGDLCPRCHSVVTGGELCEGCTAAAGKAAA